MKPFTVVINSDQDTWAGRAERQPESRFDSLSFGTLHECVSNNPFSPVHLQNLILYIIR